MLVHNGYWDIDDINQAVNISQQAEFQSMTPDALHLWVRLHTHCSAMVKLLPDGSELYVGHNTWDGFYLMLRVFKRYEFGSKTPIAMSSYPGILFSADDFYQVGDLLVTETTLPNYNKDMLELVQPEALPFWVRAMTANYLAKSGPQWMEIFKRHNSGTYNNQWMVVDYGKFSPGKPLLEGLLTVGEQTPGYFHYQDQTRTLEYGYWPSYNAAVYPEVARRIKQDVMAQLKGESFSYSMVERAQIFRRDQGTVLSDESMQRMMRLNKFQTDPIAKGDPCNQVSCRSDLASNAKSRQAFGASDAKYTSFALNRAGQVVVVSGPTHDDQPAFDWHAVPELAAATPHVGQPARFDFPWFVVHTDLSMIPWVSSTSSDVTAFTNARAAVGAATIAILLLLLSAVQLTRMQKTDREETLPESRYKLLDASVKSTACPSSPNSPWMPITPS